MMHCHEAAFAHRPTTAILSALFAIALFALLSVTACSVGPCPRINSRSTSDSTLPANLHLCASIGFGTKALAFSPDGRQAIAGGGEVADLWDIATAKELHQFVGHTDSVVAAAFSADGKLVVTGSDDETARLWDTATGKELRRFQLANMAAGSMSFVAISPDGKRVLTASRPWANTDNFTAITVALWDATTGKQLRGCNDKGRALCAAFAVNGILLLAQRDDHSVHLWDLGSNKELQHFDGHTKDVSHAAISADSRQILTGSEDNTARLWDVVTGREIGRFTTHGFMRDVEFRPEGMRVVVLAAGERPDLETRRFELWDFSTKKKIQDFQDVYDESFKAEISPDGRHMLTEQGQLWDVATGREILDFSGNATRADVAFTPDCKRWLFNADHQINVFNTVTGDHIGRFSRGGGLFDGGRERPALSPDGRWVLLFDSQGAALLNAVTGEPSPLVLSSVAKAVFSPDSKRLLTTSDRGVVCLYDVATGEVLRQFSTPAADALALSPDGNTILTAAAGCCDIRTGKQTPFFSGHAIAEYIRGFSSNCRQIVTEGGNALHIRDIDTGKEHYQLDGTDVVFSPDGKRLLVRNSNIVNFFTVKVIETQTGREVSRFDGHFAFIKSMAFSPDGRLAITSSADGTTRLWEAATGKQVCTLVVFKNGTWAVMDSDNRYDCSNDGEIDDLYWVADSRVFPLRKFKQRFYDPGLLAKYLGCNTAPLKSLPHGRE